MRTAWVGEDDAPCSVCAASLSVSRRYSNVRCASVVLQCGRPSVCPQRKFNLQGSMRAGGRGEIRRARLDSERRAQKGALASCPPRRVRQRARKVRIRTAADNAVSMTVVVGCKGRERREGGYRQGSRGSTRPEGQVLRGPNWCGNIEYNRVAAI